LYFAKLKERLASSETKLVMSTKEYSAQTEIGGKIWNLSTKNLALQASGSIWARVGDTVVLATVVASDKPREEVDYLPLLVDYEEKLYAAGKIKGSRWVKREGRPSDEAVLAGRVIDRSLRPMFDSRIRNNIQVVVTVLSADQANDPDIIGLNAASAAIEISDIPWDGPIAGVRIGRINGKFTINPSFEQVEKESDLDLIVSGTAEHIIMVEAGAKEVKESDLIAAIEFAQTEIKKILETIENLRSQVKPEKREMIIFTPQETISQKVKAYEKELAQAIFSPDRNFREKAMRALEDKVLEEVAGEDEKLQIEVNAVWQELTKKLIQSKIIEEELRPDGRKLGEIRPISCEVGLLPRVHGSGLFRRGDTVVLTTVTLGGPGDQQLLEDLETEEERKKCFIHHYNMPGFASGEVSPMRSPGRREIGHGALVERALLPMIPSKENFPYTLRLVSDVLSSNGSTSMASTCASALALMDAGIPIKAAVSGIAMGLVMGENGTYKILSDILGIEDNNGHMDFKVAGTKDGVTALQLDIKVKGLTVEILRSALKQAYDSRIYILEKMLETIAAPRAEMSPYAPRIVSFEINPEKIREVIGPGGKTINEIIAGTGVKIDIEDSGLVMITSTREDASKKAVEWIKNLIREVEVGEQFQGRITRIMDFGAFAEILPGQEGLIHISELAPFRVEKVSDIVKVGDMVPVKVISIDELGRINLSRKALLPEERRDKDTLNRYIAKKRFPGP
jgi:polyribonucleotide nucleotidyltransferase